MEIPQLYYLYIIDDKNVYCVFLQNWLVIPHYAIRIRFQESLTTIEFLLITGNCISA